MTNKIYESVKRFIKNNYKFLIVYILLISSFFIELDYEIYSPGGLGNLEKRINVEDSYEEEGSFNLTYVSAKRGSLPIVLLSYIIPSWDLVSLDNSRIENEDYDEILERGRIDLNNVNEIALKVAYETANLDYSITKNDLTVYYVFEDADTNLKVGDVLLEVEGQKIENMDDLSVVLDNKEVGDTVKFKVKSDGKTKEKTGVLYESEGKKIIGMYLTNVIKVETDRKITFKYSPNESGSSGGLMSTLEIYNRITPKDITKGLTIAGTGTMEIDGTVGEIGGVKYKLMGAVKKHADVFIVPVNNYEEALKVKKENNYKIKLIKAENFTQVLESLENL